VIIWRSEDGGLTWTEHADAGASLGASRHSNDEVYGEPHLTVMPNGQWLVAIRVNLDGHVRLAASTGGRRWGRAKKLALRGYPQHLLPLKDERLLMAYGYRFEPPGIRACVSSDSGKTWDMSKEIVLRHDGSGWDLGYPVSIELDDGRVLTVYYHVQDDGLCFIEGAFYRP